jgi:endonuclease I
MLRKQDMPPLERTIQHVVSAAAMAAAFSAGALAGTVPPDSTIFPGLTGQSLLDSLVSRYKASSNLGYNSGRDTLYGKIDIVGDSLRCVYTGKWIHGGPTSAPRTWVNNNGFNCEHTWPQSLIPSLAQSDLHHLYATEENTNNARSNYPFAELNDSTQVNAWYRYDHYNPPLYVYPPDHWEQYSKLRSTISFEPRQDHKGRVARSMFYIFTMYKSMFPDTNTYWLIQKNDLYLWHVTHPADTSEIRRTRQIASYQQNKSNPFILDSTLARRAFYPTGISETPNFLTSGARLLGNRPNPFRESTVILYSLPGPGRAEVAIYNVLGLEVARLAAPSSGSGERSVIWSARDSRGQPQPPGIYFYQLKVGGVPAATRRMLLVR